MGRGGPLAGRDREARRAPSVDGQLLAQEARPPAAHRTACRPRRVPREHPRRLSSPNRYDDTRDRRRRSSAAQRPFATGCADIGLDTRAGRLRRSGDQRVGGRLSRHVPRHGAVEFVRPPDNASQCVRAARRRSPSAAGASRRARRRRPAAPVCCVATSRCMRGSALPPPRSGGEALAIGGRGVTVARDASRGGRRSASSSAPTATPKWRPGIATPSTIDDDGADAIGVAKQTIPG